MGLFKRAFKFLYKNELITNNVADKLKKYSSKNEKKEIFEPEQLQKMFEPKTNHFGETAYLLINRLLLETGCRIGEVQALTIDNLIYKNNSFQVYVNKNWTGNVLKSTKTKRSDYVNISTQLAHDLKSFYYKNKNIKNTLGFIFPSSTNNDKPISYSAIQKNFCKTMKKLNFDAPNLTLHSYRHTYATILRDAGYSESLLLLVTRHEDPAILARYSQHESVETRKKKEQAVRIVSDLIYS